MRTAAWHHVQGCAGEAARRGARVFGMEAGGECWIPSNTGTTAGAVRARSEGPSDGPCPTAGASWSMNLYHVPDDSYHTLRRFYGEEEARPTAVTTKEAPFVSVLSHGCWQDSRDERIVEGGHYGWDMSGCAYEAAKREQRVFGMEAGGQCWIPSAGGTTTDDVRNRSKGRTPGICPEGGTADSLNLYSIPDDSYAALRRRAGLSS